MAFFALEVDFVIYVCKWGYILASLALEEGKLFAK
jgi:hypothetical protein